jgi:hypothetical protein
VASGGSAETDATGLVIDQAGRWPVAEEYQRNGAVCVSQSGRAPVPAGEYKAFFMHAYGTEGGAQ